MITYDRKNKSNKRNTTHWYRKDKDGKRYLFSKDISTQKLVIKYINDTNMYNNPMCNNIIKKEKTKIEISSHLEANCIFKKCLPIKCLKNVEFKSDSKKMMIYNPKKLEDLITTLNNTKTKYRENPKTAFGPDQI